MNSYYQDRIAPPYLVKIELTIGCNLSCPFCPISYLSSRLPRQFITPELCENMASQAHQLKVGLRVELSLRGEPTLNPQVIQCLEAIRKAAPKSQITMFSNGRLLLRRPGLVSTMFDAGLNILCIDCYDGTYSRFLDHFRSQTGERIVDFRSFSAYRKHPRGYQLRVVDLVPDIEEGKVRVRKIHNNAGNVDPQYLQQRCAGKKIRPLPWVQMCTRPFRELVVYLDGNVVICCHDWKAEHVLGNIREASLASIWYGRDHLRVLQQLYHKNRVGVVPCLRCDYQGGARLGIVRNPWGVS